jgi:cell division protein FtsW (lipid II flippase)
MAYRHDHEPDYGLFVVYWGAALVVVVLAAIAVRLFGPWS